VVVHVFILLFSVPANLHTLARLRVCGKNLDRRVYRLSTDVFICQMRLGRLYSYNHNSLVIADGRLLRVSSFLFDHVYTYSLPHDTPIVISKSNQQTNGQQYRITIRDSAFEHSSSRSVRKHQQIIQRATHRCFRLFRHLNFIVYINIAVQVKREQGGFLVGQKCYFKSRLGIYQSKVGRSSLKN